MHNASPDRKNHRNTNPTWSKSVLTRRTCDEQLIKALHNTLLIHTRPSRSTTGRHLPQPKHTLNHTQLRRRRIQPRHSKPIINHHARPHNRRPPIHTPRHKRNLQKTRELILIPDRRLGMNDPALVRERHVRAGQDVVGDGLPEHLDAERVGDYFFGFSLQVGVDQGHVVVAADYVAEGGESFFYSLDRDAVWQGVAEVLQFLVCCGCGDEEAFSVSVHRVLVGLLKREWVRLSLTYPTVNRPTIRVPAIVAWQIGITSWSSASNTLD